MLINNDSTSLRASFLTSIVFMFEKQNWDRDLFWFRCSETLKQDLTSLGSALDVES